MKKAFRFMSRDYILGIEGSVEAEGDFKKCLAWLGTGGKEHQGVFKLTTPAWDLAHQKAKQQNRALEDILADGGIAALKAELHIRPIPDGFSYVVDHRFFEKL